MATSTASPAFDSFSANCKAFVPSPGTKSSTNAYGIQDFSTQMQKADQSYFFENNGNGSPVHHNQYHN